MATEALSSARDAWAEASIDRPGQPPLTLDSNWGDGFSLPTDVPKEVVEFSHWFGDHCETQWRLFDFG
eukprot:2883386-Pyramimonas_sp.AAC.1